MIRLLISIILLTFFVGCVVGPIPSSELLEPIKKQHSGNISETISKYRSLIINDGWEIVAYNVSTSDGFLKATQLYNRTFLVAYSLTVSCNQSSSEINCDITVGTTEYGHTSRVTKKALNIKELKQILDKIKAL